MISLRINITKQQVLVYSGAKNIRTHPISSATNGTGQQNGSECTPLGKHIIRAKIGEGCPVNTVFVARRPTGEMYQHDLRTQFPQRDWILTRILWLSGCQPGFNRLGQVDSMRRYIYIHGTPEDVDMSQPTSHGCIRMKNEDIIEIFDLVLAGTKVDIHV